MKTLGAILAAVLLLTGLVSAAPADETAARTAAYPGAKYSEELSKLFVNGALFGKGRAMASVTADSFDKVAKFYQSRPNARVYLGEEALGHNILRYQAAFTGADLQRLTDLAKANLGKKIRIVQGRIDVGEFRFGMLIHRPHLTRKLEIIDQTLIVIVIS